MSTQSDTAASTFPPRARLRKPWQFQQTFSNGRRFNAAMFRLHAHLAATDATPSDGVAAPIARLGISVSKRVAAHAVERNRIRRIARDSFRHLRQRLPAGDYVLLAQREAAGASGPALRAALAGLWQRALALKPGAAAPTMPVPASPPAAADPLSPPSPPR